MILSQTELDAIKEELDLLNQPAATVTRERVAKSTKKSSSTAIADPDVSGVESISQFAAILTQKDMAIEEKNQLIYMLQRKIGEIETQMQHMVALPHHTEEKEKLEEQIEELSSQIRKEKMRNAVFV